MKKVTGRTRRLIVGALISAPLVFGVSYFAASAATASEPAEVRELTMLLNIPTTGGLTCESFAADDADLAGFAPPRGRAADGGEAEDGDQAAAIAQWSDVVVPDGDDAATLSPCEQLTSRGIATPLEVIAELAA